MAAVPVWRQPRPSASGGYGPAKIAMRICRRAGLDAAGYFLVGDGGPLTVVPAGGQFRRILDQVFLPGGVSRRPTRPAFSRGS